MHGAKVENEWNRKHANFSFTHQDEPERALRRIAIDRVECGPRIGIHCAEAQVQMNAIAWRDKKWERVESAEISQRRGKCRLNEFGRNFKRVLAGIRYDHERIFTIADMHATEIEGIGMNIHLRLDTTTR